jgi:uncharacterized protein
MGADMNIHVTVVYSPEPRTVKEVALTLESVATVHQAVMASGFLQAIDPELDLKKTVIGIWGRKARLDQALEDKDRIEIYRPLRVNPKTARRERFAKQGSRGAGLFAKKRVGAKAGY